MNAPTLFDGIDARFTAPEPAPTLAERAAAFDVANQWVLPTLVKIARQWRDDGARRLSINHIFEELRARWHIATDDDSPYLLNNSYRAYFARRVMETAPDLDGMFELRRSQCDEVAA